MGLVSVLHIIVVGKYRHTRALRTSRSRSASSKSRLSLRKLELHNTFMFMSTMISGQPRLCPLGTNVHNLRPTHFNEIVALSWPFASSHLLDLLASSGALSYETWRRSTTLYLYFETSVSLGQTPVKMSQRHGHNHHHGQKKCSKHHHGHKQAKPKGKGCACCQKKKIIKAKHLLFPKMRSFLNADGKVVTERGNKKATAGTLLSTHWYIDAYPDGRLYLNK